MGNFLLQRNVQNYAMWFNNRAISVTRNVQNYAMWFNNRAISVTRNVQNYLMWFNNWAIFCYKKEMCKITTTIGIKWSIVGNAKYLYTKMSIINVYVALITYILCSNRSFSVVSSTIMPMKVTKRVFLTVLCIRDWTKS